MNRKQLVVPILLTVLLCAFFSGCSRNKERILIYSSVEDYVIEDLSARLREEFPDYDITVEYLSTGNHAARLLAEGTATDCDITYDLEYAYLEQLARAGVLADLSDYETELYCEDTVVSSHYLIQCRVGGAVILNLDLLEEKGLPEPAGYEDLLSPAYRGLISMANPKSSGTGYMFLKSLVNAWGEDEAFAYFDALTPNILQYTSSGSGPVNALLQGEAAIGFGMTSHAVTQINQGANLKVVCFEEGSPFTLYGQSIIAGKEERESVRAVFDFLVNDYSFELNEKFFPEQMFRDRVYELENYPRDIVYSDMSGSTVEEKIRLLEKWKY